MRAPHALFGPFLFEKAVGNRLSVSREGKTEQSSALFVTHLEAPFLTAGPEGLTQIEDALTRKPDRLGPCLCFVAQLGAIAINNIFAVMDVEKVAGHQSAPVGRERKAVSQSPAARQRPVTEAKLTRAQSVAIWL